MFKPGVVILLVAGLFSGCDSTELVSVDDPGVPQDSSDSPSSPPELFPARADSAFFTFVAEGGDQAALMIGRLSDLNSLTVTPSELDFAVPLTFQAGSDSLFVLNRRIAGQVAIISARDFGFRVIEDFFIGIIGNHNQVTWPKLSTHLYLNPREHFNPISMRVASLPLVSRQSETVLFEDAVPIAARNDDVLVYFPPENATFANEIKIYDPVQGRFVATRDGRRIVLPAFQNYASNYIVADFDSRNAGLAVAVQEARGSDSVYSVYFCHIGFTNFEKIWETPDEITSVMVSVDGYIYLEINPPYKNDEYLGRVSYKAPEEERTLEVVLVKEALPGIEKLYYFRSSHFE